MNLNTVVHVEIPAEDLGRAQKFYHDLFGWEFQKNTMPGMEYWMAMVNGPDDNPLYGLGLMKRQNPSQGITNYIGVASLEESVEKAQALGGKILMPKMAVPTHGYFAWCQDTEGNVFALWEENKSAQ